MGVIWKHGVVFWLKKAQVKKKQKGMKTQQTYTKYSKLSFWKLASSQPLTGVLQSCAKDNHMHAQKKLFNVYGKSSLCPHISGNDCSFASNQVQKNNLWEIFTWSMTVLTVTSRVEVLGWLKKKEEERKKQFWISTISSRPPQNSFCTLLVLLQTKAAYTAILSPGNKCQHLT